ncbi:MAG: hypothetical protein ACJASZ_002447, partial [Yoonia sp.]
KYFDTVGREIPLTAENSSMFLIFVADMALLRFAFAKKLYTRRPYFARVKYHLTL